MLCKFMEKLILIDRSNDFNYLANAVSGNYFNFSNYSFINSRR